MHSFITSSVTTMEPSDEGGVVITASSMLFNAVLASPLEVSAILMRVSSEILTSIEPKPLSLSDMAFLRILTMSFASRGFNWQTVDLDTRALFTSKNGFSVVAPIRITVPSSTNGKSASC